MPEEVVPIVVIAIMAFTGLSIFFIHTIFSFLRARAGIERKKKNEKAQLESSGASLTTSELESMLRKVVEEANEPLTRRIEALEAMAIEEPIAQLPKAQKTLNEELLENEGPRDLAAMSRLQKPTKE